MSQVKVTADSGGGTVSLKAPATTTSNAAVVLTLPVDDGAANTWLKSNGSGVTSWAAPTATEIGTTSGTASASTYLCGNNTWGTPSGGKILQVVSGTHATMTSTTSTSWTDVHSELELNITTTGSNKVLVTGQLAGSCNNNAYASVFRGTTNLVTAPGSSNRIPAVADYQDWDSETWATVFGTINHLDSPGAGTHTYKWRFYSKGGAAFTINRADGTDDANYRVQPNSYLTLMEVSA